MASLSKVRVQLLDPDTGDVLREVDVLTSADSVTFEDGQTFQQKLNAGTLKGDKGDPGVQGPKGDKGDPGIAGAKGETGLTGAKGDKGDQGVQGPKGDKGDPGNQGTKGADGSTWLFGSAVPSTQGTNGDFYLNTSNFDVYNKASNVWTKTGNIKGATGAQGSKGDKGDPGVQGAKGDTGSTGSKGETGVSMRLKGAWNSTTAYVNDTNYIDIVTSGGNTYACKVSNTNVAVTDTSKWELLASKGAQGAKGDTGATGSVGPKGDQGVQGPKGDQGPKGADGASVKVGTNYETGTEVKLFFKEV